MAAEERPVWRVVATQQGHYNQVLIEAGSVFDLLCYPDGSYPHAVRYEPKKDAKGNPIPEEWDEIPIKKDGVTVHRDFAEDFGEKLMKTGPKKGEVLRFGWMKRVPKSTPLGIYPPGTDFWSRRALPPAMLNGQSGLPVVVFPGIRERMPEDRRRNHAPILDALDPSEAA